MAASAMTSTGLAEFQAAVERFPTETTRALQGVADRHARLTQVKAQQNLGGALRKAIVITMRSDPANHASHVEAKSAQAYPTSMALWFELGTAVRRQKRGRYTGRIEARRYMGQAVAGLERAYMDELARVSEATARQVMG